MLDFLENQGSLEEFLKRHVKPYDPADDYDRQPFAADIKEGKNDPIYNAHSYHTKVPPRSIIPYILHYTQPGDLVLDLFCGSGMTGVAAQMCASPPGDILEQFPELKDRVGPRACILNDLSPAACHIAYNYNTPVDVDALKREFERIKAAVKDEFDWLYGTEHYEPAIGDYALTNPEVLSRLKNPPSDSQQNSAPSTSLLEEDAEVPKTWTLLSRTDVEQRLGYPVSDLPRDQGWKEIDVSQVEEWICIPATIQYTIWSDVYRCEGFITIDESTGKISTRGKNAGKPIVQKKRVTRGCGGEIVLWDAAVDKESGDIVSTFNCSHCMEQWQKKQLTMLRPRPVVTDYVFIGLRAGKRQLVSATIFRKSRRFTRKENQFLEQINERPIPHQHPKDGVDNGREMLRHGLVKRGIQTICDFYTKRNLWAMARLWKEIESQADLRVRHFLRFAFTSIIPYVSLKQSYGGGGGGLSSTLYIASLTSEKNVGEVFVRKADSLLKSLNRFNALANTTDVHVLLGSADNMPLPTETVDYIFADPPFGSNIYYADCSLLWETWLGQLTDESMEMVVSDRRTNGPFKTLDDYAKMMTSAFCEMFRVLKPDRWATVEFSNSDGRVFNAVKQAIRDAGFEIANMLVLEKTQKSFKQVKGLKGEEEVVDKDVLFNLHKPTIIQAKTSGEDRDLTQQVADAVRKHLQMLPERIKTDPDRYSDQHRTTATIHITLMNILIPRGVSVDHLNLPYIERVCSRYFRKIGQHWYLRGEAVTNGNGGGLIQEEIAVKDEVSAIEWLRQKLQVRPMLVGELKPLWMRATGLLPAEVSQQLDMEVLLRENFWKDAESNRWREPTEEERELMNDSQTLRVLHDAERFLAGSLKRQASDADRCEWIEAIFRACRAVEEQEGEELPALRDFDPVAGYRMISQLFHGVLSDRIPAAVFGRVEKQARVAASRLREGIEPDKTGKKSRESKNQLELELEST